MVRVAATHPEEAKGGGMYSSAIRHRFVITLYYCTFVRTATKILCWAVLHTEKEHNIEEKGIAQQLPLHTTVVQLSYGVSCTNMIYFRYSAQQLYTQRTPARYYGAVGSQKHAQQNASHLHTCASSFCQAVGVTTRLFPRFCVCTLSVQENIELRDWKVVHTCFGLNLENLEKTPQSTSINP